MAQSSKYQYSLNTKTAEKKYNLNVDDLMNEDSDDDNNEDFSDDEELKEFIKSAGLPKSSTLNKEALIKNS